MERQAKEEVRIFLLFPPAVLSANKKRVRGQITSSLSEKLVPMINEIKDGSVPPEKLPLLVVANWPDASLDIRLQFDGARTIVDKVIEAIKNLLCAEPLEDYYVSQSACAQAFLFSW